MTYWNLENVAERAPYLSEASSFDPPKVHFYLVFFRDESGCWGGGYTPKEAKQNAVDNWASTLDTQPDKDAKESWLRDTVSVRMTAPLADFLAYVWPRIEAHETARAPWNARNHPPTPYLEKRQW